MNNHFWGRTFGGLMLLAIGGILLLNLLGYTDISIGELFSNFWPMFLILGGLTQLGNGMRSGSGFFGGILVLGLGVYFQAYNLGYIYMSPGEMFKFLIPVLLIAGGLHVLFKPRRLDRKKDYTYTEPKPLDDLGPNVYHPEIHSNLDEAFEQAFPEEEEKKRDRDRERQHARYHFDGSYSTDHEKINKSGFIGDVRIGQDYFQLKPMNISHFIGDTVIDLTKAQIPYGETKIAVSAFIGDVKVFIPEDMDLGITVNSSSFIGDMKVLKEKQGGFMSSVSSQTPYYNEASKKVKLNVSVFVGDVRVNTVG